MQFKEERQKNEYQELIQKNYPLSKLLELVDFYSLKVLGKEIVITSIYRSQEEQDALYAEVPIENRPRLSPHQIWQAADLRASIYTEDQISSILSLVNHFSYAGGQRKAGIYHTIAGNVQHLHLQLS